MLSNCAVEDLRVPWTAKRSNQSILKETLNIHWKDWCWSWSSNTLATWGEVPACYKRPWCWERLKAGEGDDRGWDGWMASLTQWTWVWASSGSCDGQGAWCAAIHGITKSWTWLNDQATTKIVLMNWGHREKKNPDLSCGWQATERTLGQPNSNTFYYFQTI